MLCQQRHNMPHSATGEVRQYHGGSTKPITPEPTSPSCPLNYKHSQTPSEHSLKSAAKQSQSPNHPPADSSPPPSSQYPAHPPTTVEDQSSTQPQPANYSSASTSTTTPECDQQANPTPPSSPALQEKNSTPLGDSPKPERQAPQETLTAMPQATLASQYRAKA